MYYNLPYHPTLLPGYSSLLLSTCSGYPRLSLWLTWHSHPDAGGQEKMRSRGLLLKSINLSLMPWHTLNYCSHSTMATDDFRCFSGVTKEAGNYQQALFALANDGCLLKIDKLLLIHNRFSAHFVLSGQISPRSYLLRASSRLAIKFPTFGVFGSAKKMRRFKDASTSAVRSQRTIIFFCPSAPCLERTLYL